MDHQHTEILKAVQSNLMKMHRLLMASQKSDLEQIMGREIPSTEWMQLLISRQEYAWMKPILTIMSDIDALMDNFEVNAEHLRIIRQELDNLFLDSSDRSDSFFTQYSNVIKKDPDAILFHGHLRKSILTLPKGLHVEDAASIREKWHVRPKRH